MIKYFLTSLFNLNSLIEIFVKHLLLVAFHQIYSAGPKLRIWPIFPKFLAQNLEYGILRGETPELRIWPTTKKVTLAVRNILSLLPTFVQVRFYIFKYKYFIENIYIYMKYYKVKTF